MREWQRRELEQRLKEQEWFNNLPTWMKVVDNHWYYILILILILPIAFSIGLGIGLLL